MSVEEALVDGKAGVPLFLPVAFVPLGGPFRHWPKSTVLKQIQLLSDPVEARRQQRN